MNKPLFYLRFLSGFLILTILAPDSAYPLRPTGLEEAKPAFREQFKRALGIPARMEEAAEFRDPRRQRTHNKILSALQNHPGGRLTIKRLADLADVSTQTPYNHNYRSLIATENERRAGLKPPLPAIEIDVVAAITRALKDHAGGRLTVKGLAGSAGVSVRTLYYHNYRSLIADENEHRAGLKPPLPAIIVSGPGRSRRYSESAAGLEERMPQWMQRLFPPAEFERFVASLREAVGQHPRVAVLFEPELINLGQAGFKDEFDLAIGLVGLSGSIREAVRWPSGGDLMLGLLTAENLKTYEGYRIIQVDRRPGIGNGSKLLLQAVPAVVVRALVSGQARFEIDPALCNAGLEELRLPEVLARMTDLFA